ncbi:MAG: hypothetical protein LBQ91_01145 [Oscillospiraceae bacterium]|jgi:hypothetical protein|nr:hypothetical protein [Oscillospiraceae bacterium]
MLTTLSVLSSAVCVIAATLVLLLNELRFSAKLRELEPGARPSPVLPEVSSEPDGGAGFSSAIADILSYSLPKRGAQADAADAEEVLF